MSADQASPRLTTTILRECIAVLIAIVAVGWSVGSAYGSTVSSSSVMHATSGPFQVVGNKVLAPNGSQFVPYGTVVECPAVATTNIANLCKGYVGTVDSGTAIVAAAAQIWHSNVVRFQLAQENLFSGPGGSVNPVYVALVNGLVSEANSYGMVAIITLQEEEHGGYSAPTSTSTAFWSYMATDFAGNDNVFFDLFNEPYLPLTAFGSTGTYAQVWNTWRNGGEALSVRAKGGSVVGTTEVQYVGMQSLVDTIRATGDNNIIVAESPGGDRNLSQLPTHYLTGSNIAYGVEPNLANDKTQAEQYLRFGRYTTAVPIMPEAFLDNYGTSWCDPTSPEDLPNLLSYLKGLHMGLIFWSLDPGDAVVGTNLDDPTSYPSGTTNSSSANCPYTGGGRVNSPTNTIGDGADILAYFTANSVDAIRATASVLSPVKN
jgi:hypothetical protein